jgi:hypothetical protein
MTANQLAINVEQAGVPGDKNDSKGDGKNKQKPETKTRSLTINVRRIGNCDGNITLKVAFIGYDVAANKRVINQETEVKAEATPGKGNSYTETSAPFTYIPPGIDKKTKKVTPDSGTKPSGWVVRVYQQGRFVTAAASSPELVSWIAKQ